MNTSIDSIDMMNKLNEIDEENSLNKRKCRKDDELNSISLEVKVFEWSRSF